MAEREGFEPSRRGLPAYTISNRAPSTTRTSLRVKSFENKLLTYFVLFIVLTNNMIHSPCLHVKTKFTLVFF
jgi:hypothetical protein